MLSILKAEIDLAVGKIQFHLTEIYLYLKYLYMPRTTGMRKESVMDSALQGLTIL